MEDMVRKEKKMAIIPSPGYDLLDRDVKISPLCIAQYLPKRSFLWHSLLVQTRLFL